MDFYTERDGVDTLEQVEEFEFNGAVYTDCVEVCPVDCFYEGPEFLVIDPDECIDCGLCVPECPIEAIYPDDELPKDQIEFIEINLKLSEVYENITESKEPLPEAEKS